MEGNVISEAKSQEKGSFLYYFFKIINWLYGIFASLNKFRRSSFLSIIILLVIFFLVQGLDQAYTLLVDMIEDPISGSLILCYVIISVFALVISHYPIYLYYAKDINDSKDENFWYIHKWILGYRIFTFNKKPAPKVKSKDKKDYTQDYNAKYFRYALGLSIFSIWTFYIYKTYEPKLLYAYGDTDGIWYFNMFLYFFPYILMLFLLPKKRILESKNADYITAQRANGETNIAETKAFKRFYTYGVFSFYFSLVISIMLLVLAAFWAEFNTTSYYLLQFLTLSLSLTYISFRSFRSKLYTYAAIKIVKYIEINFNYVLFFFIIALLIFGLIVYCNIAVAYDWPLPNAMAILFGYFYIFYYGLACVLKYLFVIQAIRRQSKDYDDKKIDNAIYEEYSGLDDNGISRLIPLAEQKKFVTSKKNNTVFGVLLIIAIVWISWGREVYVHQLETFETPESKDVLLMKDYLAELKDSSRIGQPLIFVASHGGAVKANIWTMKLLNHLQEKTDGEFLKHTASFSGASGGMMGLSMYAVLSGQFPKSAPNPYKSINIRIDSVAEKNYASMDISYTLGWDLLRKIRGVHLVSKHRDRAYYSMVAYQNLLEGKKGAKDNRRLTSEPFQQYWNKNIYKKNGYYPAILVNTAKTNGRRGVFSSVHYDQEETDLFLNADNLAQLEPIEDGKRPAISFYQAVSCTNRFPGFSPAAKIKGYGHYIDAGAIDNSGLLTSLDWYDRLKNKKEDAVIKPETNVIFVEIINGKSNYIKYLLEKFQDSLNIDFFDFDEKEKGNLSAVLSAGANLDKNPDYFSDLIKRLQDRGRKPVDRDKHTIGETHYEDPTKFNDAYLLNSQKYSVKYMPIYLPRVTTLKDVEKFIGGEIKGTKVVDTIDGKPVTVKDKLIEFLQRKNDEIYNATEDTTNRYEWKTYEPTLARHLSESTIRFYDSILEKSKEIDKTVCDLIEELKINCKPEP